MCRIRLWKWVFIHWGTGGGADLFPGNFERWLKEGSGNRASLSAGALLGELGGGASLLGIQKDM